MKISLIQPSRNNLKYLKWSYDSIRKNQGSHEVEICVADDFSNDGTWEWCKERMQNDPHFKAIRNEGPNRLGHTILYDRLINEVATKDVAMIYHADMYLCPGAIDSIEKLIKPKTIVSLTRIEPPLHPPGPEKVFINWGATEPEQFNESEFLSWFSNIEKKSPTEGIFAPWAFYRQDFQEIGGHDPLYAPQSKEDSDIFNRFQLGGVSFLQTWEGYVYHMTCRGSRFNPTLTTPGKNSNEWESQNIRSTRNFIRKWGHFVKHDALMKPIIPPLYNIGFIVKNSYKEALVMLEPWCSNIKVDMPESDILNYIQLEQKNTKFDLTKKITRSDLDNDIVIEFNLLDINPKSFDLLQNLSEIIKESGEVGQFQLDVFMIEIKSLKEYQKELINLSSDWYQNKLL